MKTKDLHQLMRDLRVAQERIEAILERTTQADEAEIPRLAKLHAYVNAAHLSCAALIYPESFEPDSLRARAQ